MELLLLAPAALSLYSKLTGQPAKPGTEPTQLATTGVVPSVKGVTPDDFRKWTVAQPSAKRELNKTFGNLEPPGAPSLFYMDPSITMVRPELYDNPTPTRTVKTGTTFKDATGREYFNLKDKDPAPTGTYRTNTSSRAKNRLMGVTDPIVLEKKEVDYLAPNTTVRADLLDTAGNSRDPRRRARDTVTQNIQNNLNGYRLEGTNNVENKPAFMNMVDGHFMLRAKPFMKASMRVANQENGEERSFNEGGRVDRHSDRAALLSAIDKTRAGPGVAPAALSTNATSAAPLVDVKPRCAASAIPNPLLSTTVEQRAERAKVRAAKTRRGRTGTKRGTKGQRTGAGEAKRQGLSRRLGRLRGLNAKRADAVQALQTAGVILRAENPLLTRDRTMAHSKNDHVSLGGMGGVADRGQTATSKRRRNAGTRGSATPGGGAYAFSDRAKAAVEQKDRTLAGRAGGGLHETIDRAAPGGARCARGNPGPARTVVDGANVRSAPFPVAPAVQSNQKTL